MRQMRSRICKCTGIISTHRNSSARGTAKYRASVQVGTPRDVIDCIGARAVVIVESDTGTEKGAK